MKDIFLARQKQFLKQHGQVMDEENKKNDENIYGLICYLCHSKIDSETEEFGVPGFACISNVYDFAVF